ncbi:antitoxin Xre/MbcA/ParS toxin-binding domain-containing protein [Sphingobium indicum]
MMIAEACGLADSLGLKTGPRSPLAIANRIKAGLPLSSLERLSKAIAPDDASFPYRFVPRATLTRRKGASEPKLTVDEGNRVAAVAKVWEFAMEIYHDEIKAREFLYRSHPMLENQRPIDVATDTGVGADLVINLLGRAAYGGGA